MGMVFPAGGANVSWRTKAETEAAEEKVGTGAIALDELRRLAELGEGEIEIETVPSDVPADIEDVEEAVPGDDVVPPEAEIEVSEELEVGGDPIQEATEAVQEAQDALETVEVALETIDGGGEPEIELDEGGDDGVVEEFEIEIGGDEEEEAEESACLAEDAPAVEAPAAPVEAPAPAEVTPAVAADTDETTVEAEDSSRFVKIAKLSPQNKKKLAHYWKSMLGYDPEYVNLMVRDYE